jgi:hypothetical protein
VSFYSQAETAVVKVLLASYPKAVLKRDGERTYPLHAAVAGAYTRPVFSST